MVGYEVHLSTSFVNEIPQEVKHLHDSPEPEERNGIWHRPPSCHLQTVLRRDRVRGERGRVTHVSRVPVVDVREAAEECTNLLNRSQLGTKR